MMVTPISEGIVPWPEEFAPRYVAARLLAGQAARASCCARPPTRTPTPSRSSTATCA